ncbi:MAG: hypothetical protein PWR03_2083 [Tenuifilum sp.]|jgi:O-antigen/teichoic acid export membrane protein|uniref:lipopolysaccharide biosynthesis protein n=1 Tax=Tenuifilum sp. TaxID=2760880 RepID=UPI0024ABB2A6|nr:MATE family efflux transporter [Tenuifilum sp.]MDI3527899.1 hypothetical protein [Tenuifilum sp.]
MLKGIIQNYIERYKNAHERTKLLFKNIVSGFFIKGGSIVCNFLLVPLTIDYVNVTTYGIWLTLSSIIGWASFFDVGLGHGLRNRFAESIALGQKEQAKHYVSSAYYMLFAIVFSLGIVFALVNPLISWTAVLAAPKEMEGILSVVVPIVVFSFLLQLLFKLITSLLMARQWQAKASLVSLIGNILNLTFIYIATKTTNGSLLILATIFSTVPTMVLLAYNIYYFSTSFKEFTPNIRYVRKSDLKSLFGLGGLFFLIQIAAIVQFQTANILIAHWLGPDKVTTYNVSYKLFSVITMTFSLIVAPYWSAFTEAYAKKDYYWIKNIVKKTLLIWKIYVLVGIAMLLSSPFIYRIWVGDRLAIPFLLSAVMLAYALILSYGSIYVMFINGIGKIRVQTLTSLITPFLFLALAYIFVNILNFGLPGIVLAIILANFYGPLIAPIQYKKIINY